MIEPWKRIFVCAGLIGLVATTARAEDYTLGAQDKLLVKVVEWRGSQGSFQEWTPVGGEYTIAAQGTLSLPLVGVLPAEGQTTSALANMIAIRLQEKLGLTNKPDASVEVTEYRPVFVLGGVEKPGPYPYQPGLTVLKALTLAGGFYRPADGATTRLGREAIAADGTYQIQRLQVKRFLIRRARLEAELGGAKTITMPAELRQEPDAAALLAQEVDIMEQRAAGLRSKLAAFADLKTLYGNEVVTLDQMAAISDRQIGLARDELNNINALREKGLAVASRQSGLERTVADLESRKLEAQTSAVRAREAVSRAEHDAVDAVADFKAKATDDLVQAQDDVKQSLAKLAQAKGLLDEATTTAPALLLERQDPKNITATYSIVRKTGDRTQEMTVDENAAVQPGDVIRVLVQRSATEVLSSGGAGKAEGPATLN
jgi:exopolysaccharide production protein ExoF